MIGCAIARELSRYKCAVAVVEALPDVCTGTSGANSAIIHSGYDPVSGTLMAKYNALGSRMFRTYAAMLDVPYKQTGSLTVATDESECETLKVLLARGEKNGIKGLKLIGCDEAHALEPMLADGVISALYAPTAAIIDPFELTYALRENAESNGVHFRFNFDLGSAEVSEDGITLRSTAGDTLKANKVINCAGGRGGEVARMLGELVYLTHRAGEYLLFDEVPYVGMPIFQTPTALGKGVLVSPTVHGNFFIGPTAVDCNGSEAAMRREAFDELKKSAEKSVKNVPYAKRITSFVGVRSLSPTGDFIIGSGRADGKVYNVIGIGSPGLSSVPAIASSVARGFGLEERRDFNPARKSIVKLKGKTASEKNALISSDPAYGNVVCMCSLVSEAEVVEAVRRGARTVDGVKKRVGTGMGRCQGGFCESKVIDILSRELGVSAEKIVRKRAGGRYLGEGV